ncbi:MAG: hypothetical protein GX633_01940 [Clostridiales bacterium]|nr:hypothetical protein [Clostridiales bacterium]
MFLCVAILFCSFSPAFASNSVGLTFTPSLDKTEISQSSSPQTVVLSITANKSVEIEKIVYFIECPNNFVADSISSTDVENAQIYSSGTSVEIIPTEYERGSVTDYGNISITVPANTSAGTYEIKFYNL